MLFKKLNTEKHEIVIKFTAGVFFIYIDDEFYCSCENWSECRTEIGMWVYENIE